MYSYEKKTSKLKYVLITITLMILSSAVSIYIYSIYSKIDINNQVTTPDSQSSAIRLSIQDNTNSNMTNTLEDVSKCVVGISKVKNKGDSIFETNATQNLSLGTGTIISENGYIITNWHLAGNKYSSCYVTLEDGSVYNGNVVWADEDLDLAIVKINAKGLKYLSLGDSDNIKLGEYVYAIGNPIGIEFQRTITYGIVSGLNRTIKIEEDNKSSYMEGLIQTDASINQGNSGGPLINTAGEIIGINTIKIEAAEGIGFAVPINIIKKIIDSFITNGSFEEAYLGIFAYDKEAVKYLNNGVEIENGIYIAKIMTDGPLAKSNLKIGDIITKIDDNTVNRMSELRKYIYTKKPGDKVKLNIIRNNKEYTLDVNLSKR